MNETYRRFLIEGETAAFIMDGYKLVEIEPLKAALEHIFTDITTG